VVNGGGRGASRVFAASVYEWGEGRDGRANHGIGTLMSLKAKSVFPKRGRDDAAQPK